jgi:hypothetical protein
MTVISKNNSDHSLAIPVLDEEELSILLEKDKQFNPPADPKAGNFQSYRIVCR